MSLSMYKSFLKKVIFKINRIPGGSLLFPMLIAAIINSFFPSVIHLGKPFSSLFSGQGTMPIICMMIVLTGITTDINSLVACLKSSGILVLIKLFIDITIGFLLMKLLGLDGIFGISTLALVACLTSCNPGIYMALMNSNSAMEDRTVFVLLNIVALPFIPVSILSFSNGNGVNATSILATIVPFALGIFWGYILEDIKEVAQDFNKFLLPFLGFCLGTNINLLLLKEEFVTGIILYMFFMIVHFPIMYLIERKFLGKSGLCTVAICNIAGVSITVPSLVFEVEPLFKPYLSSAVLQISSAVVISSLLVSIIFKVVNKRQV